MQFKYHLHDTYEYSEIEELLRGKFPNATDQVINTLAEEVRGHLYEVGFDVTADDQGNITEVTMIEEE